MKKVMFVLMMVMLSGCSSAAAQSTTPAKIVPTHPITSPSAVRAADVAEVVPSLTPKTSPSLSLSAVPAVTEHPAVILAPKRKVTVAPSVLVAPTAAVTCPGPYNIVLTGERCTQPWADGTVHSVPYGELNPEIYGTFVPNPLTITITQLCELYLAPALQGGYAMRPSLAPGVQVPLFGFQIIPSTGAKWWWTGIPVGDPPANDPGVYTVQGWLEDGCGA